MEDNFSPQQSLQLIQSMIDKTKENISYNRVYFLMWGWISFIGITGQFVLKVVLQYPHHYLIWLITFVGGAGSILYTMRNKKRQTVQPILAKAWAIYGVVWRSHFLF